MTAFDKSVGTLPFLICQAVFVLCLLALAMLSYRTLWYGPSVLVPGLKQPTTLAVHGPRQEYAEAIAKRFLREYWSWSYNDFLRARMRASYLCDFDTGALVMQSGYAKATYYKTLLVTSRSTLKNITVAKIPKDDGYLISAQVQVLEWVSFIATEKSVQCDLELHPTDDSNKENPLMVTAFSIKTIAPDVVRPVEASRTQADEDFALLHSMAAAEQLAGRITLNRQRLDDEAEFFASDIVLLSATDAAVEPPTVTPPASTTASAIAPAASLSNTVPVSSKE